MEGYKLINVRVFNPAFKDVKERCEYTYCKNSDNCELYKQNKCVHDFRNFGCIRCPYGRYSQEEGYTQRAKSFHSWMYKKKETYKPVLDKIEFSTNKLAKIGDYIYLPYPHLKNYVNSMEGIINEYFIKVEDFIPEKIIEIINFKPQALMGGEITDFQNKYIPKFIQHLEEEMPTIYEEVKNKYPEKFKEYSEISQNYIGRTAYVKTLKKDIYIEDTYGDVFLFDGEFLINENYKPTFAPFENSGGLYKFKIEDHMTYKITNNEQVTNKTKFVD